MSGYRAFISYSHVDTPFAARLQRSLEKFRLARETMQKFGLPSNRLGSVFRDVSDLGASKTLNSSLSDALSDSAALIVVCSPSAVNSDWVALEIREYRRIHGDNALVLPIIASSAGTAAAETMFPAALGADVPLASDARSEGDGDRLGVLKVVAGLLNCGLDEIVHRDSRRRQRQLLAGISLTTAVAVTLAIFALFALNAREDAQRRLSQSEDLVGFMLNDLRQQLIPVGQVDVLKSVGDKALEYFESLSNDDLTVAGMLRKARALYQIGEVYFELGEFHAAQRSFQQSLLQTRQLAAERPDDIDRLFELSQAEFWTGYSSWYAGDLDLAEKHLTAYSDAANELRDREPGNLDWLMEIFWASNNLGSLAMRRSNFAVAKYNFESALVGIDVVIDREPTTDRLFERSTVLSWLGYANYRLGDLAASKAAYLSALDMNWESSNALHQEERSFQLSQLAEVELHLGNLSLALSLVDEAEDISSRLSASDPSSMELLFASTLHRRLRAKIALISQTDISVGSLIAAARKLLGTDEPPPTWRMLAIDIASIGVRVDNVDAIVFATQLLDARQSKVKGQELLEQAYLGLAASMARRDKSYFPMLTQLTASVEVSYEESDDFLLVLPLLNAYDIVADGRGKNEMLRRLETAGSRHPGKSECGEPC
jgi:tetratricopeptide (TPR) repeat protein